MKSSELATLIAGAQAGRGAAFDALVDAYADRMYGYLYRLLSSRVEAEDLLQELFVRLVRAIGRYQHQDNFEAFLFRIATNLYRDHCRRIQRSGKVSSLDAEVEGEASGLSRSFADPSPETPASRLEMAETADRLQVALAGLAPAEREVIMLRHYSDLSFKEIAAAMDTPLGTALARAHRGLAKLRTLFEEH